MGYIPIDLKTWHECNKHRPEWHLLRPPPIRPRTQAPSLLCVWVCACVAVVIWCAVDRLLR